MAFVNNPYCRAAQRLARRHRLTGQADGSDGFPARSVGRVFIVYRMVLTASVAVHCHGARNHQPGS